MAAEGKGPADRQFWPLWVQVGLWGLPNRAWARACVWLSVGVAVACMVFGFWNPFFFVGVLFLAAAWWYWSAIRWVDRHGRWS